MANFVLKRTTTSDLDFVELVNQLDNELWNELNEDQATYDQYNKVPDIKTAVLIYQNDQPVACGCFKQWDAQTVEIKRMFVQKKFRGMGLSKRVLNTLEQWAIELGYKSAILETSIHLATARNLYNTYGYRIISNYGQYAGLEKSVCMKKEIAIPEKLESKTEL